MRDASGLSVDLAIERGFDAGGSRVASLMERVAGAKVGGVSSA
jgi:hypothetical protein